jgi:hypothetical protein
MRIGSLALGLAIAAVQIEAPQAASPAKQPITISFGLAAGGKSVDCGHDIAELGAAKLPAKLRDARFYISAPALIDKAGKEVPIELERNDWQYANVALLNFADKSGSCKGMSALNDSVKGTAPPGRYQGFSFVVGVPSMTKGENGKDVALNHSNFATAPAPLDIQSMSWNWQAGRKFMKIEVDPEGGVTRKPPPPKPASRETPPTGAPDAKSDLAKADTPPTEPVKVNADGTITVVTWMLHLGSTGCKGDPLTGEIISCASPNRIPVKLSSFDPATQRVVLDLEALVAGIDLSHDKGGATGCMSGPVDPECAPIFENIGLNLTETAPDANDAGRPSGRVSKVFRAASKTLMGASK